MRQDKKLTYHIRELKLKLNSQITSFLNRLKSNEEKQEIYVSKMVIGSKYR